MPGGSPLNAVGPASASHAAANAGPGASLRAGVSISVTVLEDLGQGLWRVEAGGRTLTARSETSLSLGATFLARVETGPDGESLLLRAESRGQAGLPGAAGPSGFDQLLRDSGLAPDPAGRWAASALLAQGQKALPAVLARVRRAILSEAGAEPRTLEARAGLAAGFEARGLASSPEAVDALISLAEGRTGGGGGSGEGASPGRDQSRDQARDQAQAPEAALAPENVFPPAEALGPLPIEEAEKRLAAFLRGLCLASAGPGSGGAGADSGQAGLLGLFNHARSPAGGPILIPYAFSLDSIAFSGVFRILLPYMAGGPGRIETRCRVQDQEGKGEKSWSFDLGFGGPRPQLSLLEAAGSVPGEDLVRALGESLVDLGCRVGLAPGGSSGLDVRA